MYVYVIDLGFKTYLKSYRNQNKIKINGNLILEWHKYF